jgi:AraC-like DNA-binding protein/mannose-6-phosphate isomerase-like protein (cupin superfamily)
LRETFPRNGLAQWRLPLYLLRGVAGCAKPSLCVSGRERGRERRKNFMKSNLVFCILEDNTKNIKFESVIGKEISHQFPFHIHHSLCIGLITKGMRKILFSDHELCVQENEMFVINPLQSHAIQQLHPHDYAAITVKGIANCPIFREHIQSIQCKKLFISLLNEIQNGNIKEVSNLWDKLFVHLPVQQFTTTTNSIIEKSIVYIAKNYHNPITVSDIAKNNCMSTFHYCRIFKSLIGISPHKYLTQYRLSMSHKFLQVNNSIFDVAINSGFYDSSHFIRNFYNHMAISPKSYSQSIIKNSKNIQREAKKTEYFCVFNPLK